MTIPEIYANVMSLKDCSIFDHYAERNIFIDQRYLSSKHADKSAFPPACLIGDGEIFGVMLNIYDYKSLKDVEFKLWHEFGHYMNEGFAGLGKNMVATKVNKDIYERHANTFAVFALIPQHPIDGRSIFHVAKEQGIPFDAIKGVLSDLSLEPDPFFRHYYDEYF